VAVASATIDGILKIELLAEGSNKATINENRTRNLPIARLVPYPLGRQALIKHT